MMSVSVILLKGDSFHAICSLTLCGGGTLRRNVGGGGDDDDDKISVDNSGRGTVERYKKKNIVYASVRRK